MVNLLDRVRSSGSAYWQAKTKDIGLIRDVGDIPSLPFTVKEEFRETYPRGMFAVPAAEIVRVHASSGTSGKPTIVGYTAKDIAIFAEVNARSLSCVGGTAEDVVHVAYGYGLFTGGLGLHYGAEELGAVTVPASGGNTRFQVELLVDLEATGIACTPSFSLLLAEQAAEMGVLDRISLRWGIHGAEPWSEGLREKIQEAWGSGYDACDIYGLSEIIGPGVAAECRENKGGMHIFEDHFYPEIVDPDTGQPVPEGQLGELIITTLTKGAQPVLRYRTRDITRFLPGDCPCGRTSRRIDRLQGRVDDMLVIRGVNVYPRAIEAVLLDDPAISGQFAIVVDRRGTMAELEARVELIDGAHVADRDHVAARLAARLAEVLRVRVEVAVGDPGSVPRQYVGKAKRVFERVDETDPLA